MKTHDATETAYKNGYAKGYEDGKKNAYPRSELKECPFCGGEAITRVRGNGTYMQRLNISMDVGCPKCSVYKKVGIELCDTNFEEVEQAMNSAIEEWNKRREG